MDQKAHWKLSLKRAPLTWLQISPEDQVKCEFGKDPDLERCPNNTCKSKTNGHEKLTTFMVITSPWLIWIARAPPDKKYRVLIKFVPTFHLSPPLHLQLMYQDVLTLLATSADEEVRLIKRRARNNDFAHRKKALCRKTGITQQPFPEIVVIVQHFKATAKKLINVRVRSTHLQCPLTTGVPTKLLEATHCLFSITTISHIITTDKSPAIHLPENRLQSHYLQYCGVCCII